MNESIIDWYLMNPCPYCRAETWQRCRSVNPPHAPLKYGHTSRHHLVAWYRNRWMDDPQLRDWLSENGHLFTALFEEGTARHAGSSSLTCELCHEDDHVLYLWRGMWICCGCQDGALYYDSLTPEERVAEDASIARHVDETIRRDHGDRDV